MSILSIQSHVCYGHVGNAAAVFPLQRLGFDVWPVHCLQFSNHLGYSDWSGEVFATEQVAEVLKGIERRGVFPDCEAVLSGYLGTAELGDAVLETVASVRQANPRALFLCDPVMGDEDTGVYVHPEIPDFMRFGALKSADIITPNLFELGILADREVYDRGTALAAARHLLNDNRTNLKIVMVTSIPVQPVHATEARDPERERIGILVVTRQSAHLATTPKLDFGPLVKGTGDVIAALFLGRLLRNQGDAGQALQGAMSSLYGVLDETLRRGTDELCLIAAQEKISAPDLNDLTFMALTD
ncbi:pyridoxal kinase PdxY [Denitrobaculum tricleocarpae]|uniref:pyridoxal kinase n=1 Tax=Denitrobaculum tricleocarpae TaxID=2591009 RepID=A0A545TQV0_9PROT|nr:pyridoxal kinase PdxY [Denitrobaculum tricleocarpae]TQV79596.1 pyridoxal kinase PdxY [Denitrobaculum tricleocarpae]